jgi:hypothetical protein
MHWASKLKFFFIQTYSLWEMIQMCNSIVQAQSELLFSSQPDSLNCSLLMNKINMTYRELYQKNGLSAVENPGFISGVIVPFFYWSADNTDALQRRFLTSA